VVRAPIATAAAEDLIAFLNIFVSYLFHKSNFFPATGIMESEAIADPPAEVPKIDDNYNELLQQLRREWKWGAATDFLHKFNPMLHLDFLDLAVRPFCTSASSYVVSHCFGRFVHLIAWASESQTVG